jgi:hypothetical protein
MKEPIPDWLEEFRKPPPGWDPPDDLKTPTHSPALNLAVSILTSNLIGNDLSELVGLWIAAMARLNMWYKDSAREKLPRGAYVQLFVLQGKAAEGIYTSWCVYRAAIGDPPVGDADGEYDDLMQAARDGIGKITDFMSSNSR